MPTERTLRNFIEEELKEKSFDDILELFDINPGEVFVLLYESGWIDDIVLESYLSEY
jgi:hypothetical protein